ncbi:MAG: nucleotidyltransferase family protein [Anaerolineales bacterium]|jgi:hypothetical protein|nr:nucleotidyltransferase family protein [Anaerolineales bacterium]
MKTLKHLLAGLVLTGESDSVQGLPEDQLQNLIGLALQEGLAPLLYWRLSKSGYFSSLPVPIRDTLRAAYAATWAQNQNILRELAKISGAFERAGIPLVVLKGACFLLTLYEDIGLRPMGDLDLLVPAARFDLALQTAQALGYQDQIPEPAPGLRAMLNHEVCLQKPGLTFALEIHHSLVADKTYSYAVPVDWFWTQSEPLSAPAPGARFGALLMLSPEAQLLYAASHAMLQHGGQRSPLRWFYDIDRLVRYYQPRLDWNLVLAQAVRFEWGSALAAALDQAVDYFDTPIPDPVRRALSALSDRHQDLVSQKQTQPATHTLLEYQTFKTMNREARFRFVLALAFPAPVYMRWRYRFQSVWLLPWYYLRRALGILKDGLWTLFVLLRQALPFWNSKR